VKALNLFTVIISLFTLIVVHNAWAKEPDCQLTALQTQALSQPKVSVVDYYQVMRSCPEFDGYYPVRLIQGEWVVGNRGWDEEPVNYIVDTENGFIKVRKDVLLGNKTIQVALFATKADGKVIGYYREESVEWLFGIESAKLIFYRLDKVNNRLLDVTQEVLPQITLSAFGLSDAEYEKLETIENADFQRAVEDSPLFYYELPHVGTILKVNLAPKSVQHFYNYYNEGSLAKNSDLETLEHYDSQIKTEVIELEWDKAKSRFVRQ
jgi:hypothetical protein